MTRLADIICQLGDATRSRILFAIVDQRKNVSQIVAELALTQPQVSYHLRKLKDAGLAVEEREGRWIWYQADRATPDACVREFLDLLARWSGEADDEESVATRENPVATRENPVAARDRFVAVPGHPATAPEHTEGAVRPSTKPSSGTEQDELEDFLL